MLHDTVLRDGDGLVLRPLRQADIPALCRLAATCPSEFEFMASPPTASDYYELALEARDQRPFVIDVNGEITGSTRYGDIRDRDRGLEIGWTWLHPRWQGSGVNRRMKFLLLRHAFEHMHMLRVQLKTDARNVRSQRAIEKIGAVQEGVLRHHMLLPGGIVRDTVMYSVIAPEWPALNAAWNLTDTAT